MKKQIHQKHGMIDTRFYKIWVGMKDRCQRKKHKYYFRYGGRKIKVCKEWLLFLGFKNDMYESYLKHCEKFGEKQTTIDRINNDGNYELNNCKWSTPSEQALNRNKYYQENNKSWFKNGHIPWNKNLKEI